MSSYKPKMFRSQDGCCICRAKSSSSRFTDSDKYSASFEGCFKISDGELRHGDICNACVLIVKRWKKLPVNSTKDWSHVVDARSGPGTKTVVRPKRRDEETENLKYKHVYPDFLDSTYWKRRLICCGVIFIGEHGEVMLDTRFYKSCSGPRPCPVKTGDPQPSPDTMTDIVDSASDYCETYDTENREFYNEETKKGKSNGDEVPTYGQLDPNLETFSTCDS